MLNKLRISIDNIKTWPTIAISIVLSITLLLFGIYIVLPADWLVLATTSTYPNQIVRTIFGMIIALPAIPILYLNIRYDLRTYIKEKRQQARKWMFWVGVTFFYMCALRIIVVGVFPPLWLLYLAEAVVAMILWMEGKN